MWGRREMPTGFWWGNLKARDNLEYLGAEERIMLKYSFWRIGGLL
jgi:hypothetical protein